MSFRLLTTRQWPYRNSCTWLHDVKYVAKCISIIYHVAKGMSYHEAIDGLVYINGYIDRSIDLLVTCIYWGLRLTNWFLSIQILLVQCLKWNEINELKWSFYERLTELLVLRVSWNTVCFVIYLDFLLLGYVLEELEQLEPRVSIWLVPLFQWE